MIPTAGVAVRQDHIVLMVNPHFFLKTLKTSEERGAVLKHEALHIMLGHAIQIRSARFTHKDQYNIAADLEVNQHISAPWTLPADAVTILTFPDLNLPARRVAEEYYELLIQAQREGQGPASASPTNDGRPRSSDHSAWARDNLELSGCELINPLPVSSERLKAHERDLAARLKRAVQNTPSKHHGMIPGQVFEILEKSERARRPQTDWRRELRMFLTNSRKMSRSATLRKRNKRFMTRRRLALAGHMITADAVQLFARVNADAMPYIKWGELPAELRAEALTLRPALSSLNSTSELPWTSLPRVTVHKLILTHPDLPWPSWGDFSDAQLSLIKVLRTPLSSTRLPLDLYIKLTRDHPRLLPELSWSKLGGARHASLIDQYPHLRGCAEITWPMLPLSVLAELYHMRSDLFTLSWNDLPPKILVESQMYQRQSGEVFRIERVITKPTPGFKRSPLGCKILVIADTSGSMRDRDLNLIYDHLDQMTDLGLEVHVLQVDSKVQLYSKYSKSRTVRGRGGTDLNAAFEWINAARSTRGVLTPTPKDQVEREIEERYVRLTLDGVIIVTDGCFSTPRVRPRCRVLWALTGNGATDKTVSGWEYTTAVIRLPGSG
jgi:predicted metal-dependent peptidase